MNYTDVFSKLVGATFYPGRLKAFTLLILIILVSSCSEAQPRLLDNNSHHLRISTEYEWDEFASKTPKKELSISFQLHSLTEQTLSLVQYDVKQDWDVFLNGRKAGSLVTDGNKMRVYYRLNPDVIKIGENTLTIKTAATAPDDIVISDIAIDNRSLETVLSEGTVEVQVFDKDTKKLIPSRITIVDRNNVLQSVRTESNNTLAVRPGLVYTATGKVSLQLPSGRYTIYAGRGFEYGVDSFLINLQPGQHINQHLSIQREVNTDGWLSSDTHIHTLTHSGHGDATDVERALTIAGEGIELPVITEHNKIVDFSIAARKAQVDTFFTIVTGDEFTTPVGHFNVFPLSIDATPPNHQVNTWREVAKQLPDTNRVVILNHGRDIHHRFRPFDPKRHVSSAGLALDNWKLPVNAMELINSGALLNEPMQLVGDWFGLLNGGSVTTPVGSSDSHDVGRYFVGQARTYIQSDDHNIQNINTEQALTNFKKGRVMVSFGLLAKVLVNKKYGPGDRVINSKNPSVEVEVLGPAWINAKRVSLYANGTKIREEKITNGKAAGIKWKGQLKLSKLKHDVFLVAIADGDGPYLPFWPIVKPYQPVTTSWTPYTMGISGAIWIDADGDGTINTAHEYASRLVTLYRENIGRLFKELSIYDDAVAVQAAALLHQSGVDLSGLAVTKALSKTSGPVREGFKKFIQDFNQSK